MNNPHLSELINNPLLLSQAILIHSIDETFELSDIDSLYEKFIDTLLYRWDDVRQMNFYPELLGNRNVQKLYQLMGRIALAFSRKEVTKMTFKDLIPEVVNAVSRFKSSLPQPDKIVELSVELLDVLRDRGGIFTGGVIADDSEQIEFEFQHKSIQDYLTAYTLAGDSELWKTDNFDLFTVIARREFWGRTLEFFVNAKKHNPDRFFRTYLEYLKPETVYARQLNHFVQYFLIAQEKDADLEFKLIQKAEEILLYSRDLMEIQIAQSCLGKLPIQLNSVHLDWVRKTHDVLLDNFRAAKIAQLYYVKGEGEKILAALREISQLTQLYVTNGHFYRFRQYTLLGLIEKDHQIWNNIFIQEVPMPDDVRLGYAKALLDLRILLDLRDLLDLLDLLDLRDLRDLQDWQDWRDLWDLQNLLDLRDLLDLLDLRDLRDLVQIEQKLEKNYAAFFQSSKYPTFLSEFQKISERFHALTPEQKRQYFINVDE